MATSGKEFITNFRNARLNPFYSTPSLLTRGDFAKERQKEGKANRAYEEAEQKWVDEQSQKAAPLREEIKQLSDGKVIVDSSIYDQTELQRIKNTVQKMKEYKNGVLFPGYTIISASDDLVDEKANGEFYSGDIKNIFGLTALPPRGYYGTKNNPYRVYIKYANEPIWNDFYSENDIKSGWHPKTGENDVDATHTHELSHSTHKEALKKSHPPTLSMSPEEDEAYNRLISKYASFSDLVKKLTDEYYLGNTKNASASVSGYAESKHDTDSSNKQFPFPEMFAEAYTDVLYNGESARPFSKRLIEAYADYLNEYNAIFDSEVNRTRKRFDSSNNFIKNLRSSTPQFGNNRYIVK